MRSRFFQVGLIPAVFLLDQLSKMWILRHFSLGEGIPVWPGVFHLTRVNNTGAAFGILKNSGFFLTVISILCVIVLVIVVGRSVAQNIVSMRSVAGGLVAAGALGNLVDRLRYGYVIDFLDFRVWPVFNIADAAICVGVTIVAITLFKK